MTIAASIGIELNISSKSIIEGILNCTNIDGRMHFVENKKNQMIFLDYAHTPDAYLKALQALKDNFDLNVTNVNKKKYPKLEIGRNVLFGQNVKIGSNCIIGMGSVIKKNVRSFSVVKK